VALSAGKAKYTDLVFVERCGKQLSLEVMQGQLYEGSGIDRISVVRILFTFSEGTVTYDLQALFITIQSGQAKTLDDFLAICETIPSKSCHKLCPGIDVEHYYDHYHSVIRYHIKSVRVWDRPFKRIDSTNCIMWHEVSSRVSAVEKSSDIVLCKPCKRLRGYLDHQRRRSEVSPSRRADMAVTNLIVQTQILFTLEYF